jgi:hypothetical protein
MDSRETFSFLLRLAMPRPSLLQGWCSARRLAARRFARLFEWDHVDRTGGRRQCVFRHRATKAESTMTLSANGNRNAHAASRPGVRGCETAVPMQIEAEPVSMIQNGSSSMPGWNIDIHYAMTVIGGGEFLMPQTSEATVRFGAWQTTEEIQLQQYRKYESSSTLTFDADAKPRLQSFKRNVIST